MHNIDVALRSGQFDVIAAAQRRARSSSGGYQGQLPATWSTSSPASFAWTLPPAQCSATRSQVVHGWTGFC